MFNARRGSEAVELTLDKYSHISQNVDPVIAETLSDVERQLLQKLSLINVIGKRNRPVPILLTEDMVLSLNVMHDSRERCNVQKVTVLFLHFLVQRKLIATSSARYDELLLLG